MDATKTMKHAEPPFSAGDVVVLHTRGGAAGPEALRVRVGWLHADYDPTRGSGWQFGYENLDPEKPCWGTAWLDRTTGKASIGKLANGTPILRLEAR